MESFHALEAQLFRWRRRADGLYAVLLEVLEKGNGTVVMTEEMRDIIEQYCLDRFDDENHWRIELTMRNHKGATA
jgi:hypothetical protein